MHFWSGMDRWSSYNTPPTLISGCAFRSRTIFWRFCFGLDVMMRNIKPTGCSSSLCHPLISQSVFASISIQSFEAKGGWWSWKHDDKHQCIIVCTVHIQENSGLKPIALPHMVMRVPRLLHHVGRAPSHLNDVRGFWLLPPSTSFQPGLLFMQLHRHFPPTVGVHFLAGCWSIYLRVTDILLVNLESFLHGARPCNKNKTRQNKYFIIFGPHFLCWRWLLNST